MPCTNCGAEIKGKLSPKDLELGEIAQKMEDVIAPARNQSFKAVTKSSNVDNLIGLPPIPPVPTTASPAMVKVASGKPTSIYVERRGFLVYASDKTREHFVKNVSPLKTEKRLVLVFQPEKRSPADRFEAHFYLSPVHWPIEAETPFFSDPMEEMVFPQADFWIVLNDEDHTYSPSQMSKMGSRAGHQLLRMLIIDDRPAIYMDLKIQNYYACGWQEFSEGMDWLVKALLGQLVVKMSPLKSQFLTPFALKANPNLRLPKKHEIYPKHTSCLRHVVTKPAVEFVICTKCSVAICWSCYQQTQGQLCPGSLMRTSSDNHVFSLPE